MFMRLSIAVAAIVAIAYNPVFAQQCTKACAGQPAPAVIPQAVSSGAVVATQVQVQAVAVPTALFVVPGVPQVQIVQPQVQVIQPSVVVTQPSVAVVNPAVVVNPFVVNPLVVQRNVVVQQRQLRGGLFGGRGVVVQRSVTRIR